MGEPTARTEAPWVNPTVPPVSTEHPMPTTNNDHCPHQSFSEWPFGRCPHSSWPTRDAAKQLDVYDNQPSAMAAKVLRMRDAVVACSLYI